MGVNLLDLETALERLGGDKEFLIELLGELDIQLDQNLPELRQAVEANDYEKVRSLAHGMKGASANLGADAIAEIMRTLEEKAKAGDLSDAPELVQEAERMKKELKELTRTL